MLLVHLLNWLLRLSIARGSITHLVMVGYKVKTCKSDLFTEGTPEVYLTNTCLMQ